MAGPVTDATVDALEPVAEELIVCVGERDPLGVEAVFRFADSRIIAAILAERVILERDNAAHEQRRRISEVRDARRNANPDADDFAELLEKLRASEAEVAELRQRVWGLPGGVRPAGMTIDRAEEIAAQAEERRSDDH